MTDLVSQYHRLKPELDEAIGSVLEAGDFVNGRYVKRFASELQSYMGVKHVIPCGNGTDALQIALMALGIPADSEIITPAFSFAAVAEVCELLRLKPVFADVYPDTFNINVEHAETLITSKTAAIVPVHLFGQCAHMKAIQDLAARYNLKVVEDNAQSIGAEYLWDNGLKKKSGTMSDISTLSFFPSKNLGAYGDGGAVCTDDDDLAEKARMIANHGQRVKYHHEMIGLNSRLDTLQAAVLSVKLKYLDSFNEERLKVAMQYSEGLKGIEGVHAPVISPFSSHVFHQYTLVIDSDRDALKQELNELGIPSMIYYPLPLYAQSAYSKGQKLEVTENLCKTVLSLPIGTDIQPDQTEFIIHQIRNIKKHK